MKRITLFVAVLIITSLSYSQSNKEEIDLMQATFGMEKKAVVASFVEPDEMHKDAFWALYDEYESGRKENDKKRIPLLAQYSKQYNTMTNEQADEWISELIKLASATDKLIVTYYKKIKKATSPVVAAQFYQIEYYILTSIRLEILDGIPALERK